VISDDIILTEPVGYLDFISLMKNAEVVVTDSGGIQEETTFLGVQCVTVRDNTERPVTVEVGTNHLAGTDVENVYNTVSNVLEGYFKKGSFPELWDGNAAVRIVGVLKNLLN
jgi:UDP-N-acetylglucosamine 2-epimerase (non-hydrolysing)